MADSIEKLRDVARRAPQHRPRAAYDDGPLDQNRIGDERGDNALVVGLVERSIFCPRRFFVAHQLPRAQAERL